MVEIIVPVTLFGVICIISGLVVYFRFRSRQELQLTIRSAVESGQSLSADVLAELTAALHPRRNDLRRGMMFIAVGLAVVVFAFAVDEGDAVGPLLGLSAFPFFVGVAYLVMWRWREEPTGR